MEKVLIGLILGLFGGGALGVFVLAPKAPKTPVADEVVADADSDLKAENASLKKQLAAAEKRAKEGVKPGAAGANGNAAQLQARVAELETEKKALQERLDVNEKGFDTIKKQWEDIAAGKAPMPPVSDKPVVPAQPLKPRALTPEQEAEIKAKADKLVTDMRTAIESKDKNVAMDMMKQLMALGPTAYSQYFAAYDALNAAGNPWTGKTAMGFAEWEWGGLMEEDQRNYALLDPEHNVPLSARINAVYGLTWGEKKKTSDERVEIFAAVLHSATDPKLLDAVISNLGQMQTAKAAMYIGEAARNSSYPTNTRVQAVSVLADLDDKTDWTVVEGLLNDPDAEVAKAARNAMCRHYPPVSGFYITQVIPNSQAAIAGLQVGDILTSYNGQPVTDQDTLAAAKRTVAVDGKAPLELYRDGGTITITIGPGQIGINGVTVVKK